MFIDAVLGEKAMNLDGAAPVPSGDTVRLPALRWLVSTEARSG